MIRSRLVALIASVTCCAAILHAQTAVAPAAPTQQLQEILALIDKNYVQSVAPDGLVAAARSGMLATLDPYSKYLDPASLEELNNGIHGNFGGVGMRIDYDEKFTKYWVRGPFVGSPALAAGIEANDVLFTIDGRSPIGHPIDEVLSWLRGPADSTVEIAVRRAASPDPLRFPVKRAVIGVPSVRGIRRDEAGTWSYLLDEQSRIGYVRLTHFAATTAGEFDRAVAEVERSRAKGLVLDLRQNPGGLAMAAIGVADRLLDSGRIVTFQSRTETKTFDAAPGVDTKLPIALLIDQGTASAAEILASSLQDNHRVTVIGARTYGKGMVQEIFPLAGKNGALKLTTTAYLRPSGQPIERHAAGSDADAGGVWPDPGMAITGTETETQRWAQAINDQDDAALLAHAATPANTGNDDPALAKARAVLQGSTTR